MCGCFSAVQHFIDNLVKSTRWTDPSSLDSVGFRVLDAHICWTDNAFVFFLWWWLVDKWLSPTASHAWACPSCVGMPIEFLSITILRNYTRNSMSVLTLPVTTKFAVEIGHSAGFVLFLPPEPVHWTDSLAIGTWFTVVILRSRAVHLRGRSCTKHADISIVTY